MPDSNSRRLGTATLSICCTNSRIIRDQWLAIGQGLLYLLLQDLFNVRVGGCDRLSLLQPRVQVECSLMRLGPCPTCDLPDACILIIRATHGGVKWVRGKRIKALGPGLHIWWPLTTEVEVIVTARQTACHS
jgi:hypothetical protein